VGGGQLGRLGGVRGLGDLEVEAGAGGDDPCFADLGPAHGVGVDQGPLLHADRGVAVWSPLVELPGLLGVQMVPAAARSRSGWGMRWTMRAAELPSSRAAWCSSPRPS